MKRLLILVACAAMLVGAFGAAASAESYPVYRVAVLSAFLRSEATEADESVLCSIPLDSPVLVAEERDGWCLVYTQNEQIGYMSKDDLTMTGENHSVDFPIRAEGISDTRSKTINYISIDPMAILPDEMVYEREYVSTLRRGAPIYDLSFLQEALLGDGCETTEDDTQREYRSTAPDKPYRCIYIDNSDGEFWYLDPMVTGERGGEYQPPAMNMTLDESLILCRALLRGLVDEEWLAHPGVTRSIIERWSYAGRWMTDWEYEQFLRNADAHWISFEHWSDEDVRILDDEMLATVGVNGLASLTIDWHDFSPDPTERASLMRLEDAIALANRTRTRETVLLYASPVYSNWLTESDEFHLSWYLVTSNGNYVVDCVLNEHKCDRYEY